MYCRHLDRDNDAANVCTAFPSDIPDAIFESRVDHRQSFASDHGIVWAFDPEHPIPDGYFETLFPLP
jgi:hypothetical protein